MNKPDSAEKSNYSFSFHRNQNWKPHEYAKNWERFAGWDHLARAILKVAWSPIIWKADRRRSEDFLFSDLLALDIDDGPSLDEMINALADSVVLIGTTRSHRKPKLGVVADRYRVIIPWERRITDAAEYQASISAYIKRYDADKCSDTARLLWPCTEIAYRNDPADMLELASITVPEPPKEYPIRRDAITGNRILPRHMVTFLTLGTTFGSGRNEACFITAKALAEGGIPLGEALAVISKSPFDRTGFTDRELETAVKSAYKGSRNG
jgi:hypothetical protein